MRRLQVSRPLNASKRDPLVVGGSPTPVRATGGGGAGGEGEGGVIGGGRGGVNSNNNSSGNCYNKGNGKGACRPTRDIYAPGDFGVGEEVWIHGRRFRIVDADVTTRKWFKVNLGRELKEKEDYPEDGYGAQRAKVSIPKKR